MISNFQPQKMSLLLNKRYEIVFLHEHPAGPKWGYEKIAAYVHCSKFTAIYWIKKYCQNKDLTDKLKSGRSRCTTKAQDKRIVKLAKKKHNITSTEIQKELKKQGVEVSSRTIRRRLGESGGKFVKEVSKPLLSEKHRANRFQWEKSLIIIELFLLMKIPFNYISQIERSGNSLGGEKYSVQSSIHRRFMYGVVFLL